MRFERKRIRRQCRTKHILNYSTMFENASKMSHFLKKISKIGKLTSHSVWKSFKMSHLDFSILAFSTNFCPFYSDKSGNTAWLKILGFQKLAKLAFFGIFNELENGNDETLNRDFQTLCKQSRNSKKCFSFILQCQVIKFCYREILQNRCSFAKSCSWC